MLLECQNKKRVMMAQREQASKGQLNAHVPASKVAAPTQLSKQVELSRSDGNDAFKEYKKQMQLAERQAGGRLSMTPRDQEPHVDFNTQAQNNPQPPKQAQWEDFRSHAGRETQGELDLTDEPQEPPQFPVEKNSQGKFELPELVKKQMQVLERQRLERLLWSGFDRDSPSTLEYIESQIETLNLRPNTGSSYEIQWESPRPSNPRADSTDIYKQFRGFE